MNRLLAILVLMFAVGCTEAPSGRSQLALVPAGMMDDMGQQAFEEMKRVQPTIVSGREAALVQCVSEHIIRATPLAYPHVDLPTRWEVVLFDQPSANAFALPGGRIGVHTGLLAVAQSPDQLAAVIGHEVAHLLANHGNERLTQRLGVNAILLLVGLFTDIDNQLLLEALGVGAHFGIMLPFSRAHESEADLLGLRLMATAGFDPTEAANLWRNMSGASSEMPPEFLSTHPGHDTRIRDLEAGEQAASDIFRRVARADCGR